MAEQKKNVFYRQNILFLLSNGYKLVDYDSTTVSSDFGEKKCITYHFLKDIYREDMYEGAEKLDITESNLFNIDLSTNSTFRAKYIKGGN